MRIFAKKATHDDDNYGFCGNESVAASEEELKALMESGYLEPAQEGDSSEE